MSEEMGESIIEFSEDITGAEAPPPLPIGTYPFVVKGAEAKVSSNSGNKYACTTLFIAPEDFPADFDMSNNPDGISLKHNLVSLEDTPKGRFSVRRHCETLGAPMSKQIDLNDWVGLEGIVEVTHQDYEGMPMAQAGKLSPA